MMPLLHRFVEPDATDKFNGKPCKIHGSTLRYRSNGACVECRKLEKHKRKRA